jgi:hypothetical protein
MANYYLFYYEFKFVRRLVDIINNCPPSFAAGVCPYVDEILNCANAPSLNANMDLAEFYGDAALHLLTCFRFTVRYIDDLTSGPNPWLSRLLHTSQFVMGHTISGIYPPNLTLQFTGADSANPDLFHTLDITITTTSSPVRNVQGGYDDIVKSVTTLYDKRRQACYVTGIPIVQYAHVSSTLSAHCGYNILTGQLHRFGQLIMCRGNFVVEVAKLVRRMHRRGYHLPIIWRKLKYNLKILPLPYGDSTFHRLFTDISECYQHLEQMFGLHNITAWETFATPWSNPAHALELQGHPLIWDMNTDAELARLWE